MNQKDAVNDIRERLGEYTRLLREIDNRTSASASWR